MANMHLSNSRAAVLAKMTGDADPVISSRGIVASGGTRQIPTFHSETDDRTGENFSHLKLTAEKMMQEQACMKSEVNILKSKLLKSEEEVRDLESKVLDMNNEIAMLKVEHNEDVKLWKALDSKFLATSTFSDHLAETLTLLESQLNEAEQSKKELEEKLAERDKFYEDMKSHVHDLSVNKTAAEDSVKKYKATIAKLSDTLKQTTTTLAAEITKSKELSCEKDGLEQQLSKAVSGRQGDQEIIESKTAEIQLLTKNLLSKAEEMTNLQNKNLATVQARGELEFQLKDLQHALNLSLKDNETLQGKVEMLNLRVIELQKTNAVVTCTIETLNSERGRRDEQAEEDKKEQQRRVNELTQRLSESENHAESTGQNLREKMQEIETLLKRVADSSAELETTKGEVARMRQECCDKKQLIAEMSQQEQDLRRELQEIRGNWTAAENAAKELSARFKQQLEAKQAELTSHLQDISLRNNQEMADMRKRYEEETRDAAAEEKRKGEVALEAIRQASQQELSRELDAANQRLKSAQRDHEEMVRLSKQASEEEKKKILALHAEELRYKQQELRAEMEKRCADVARTLQNQKEELQKFQQEEITKLQARLAVLLETAQEVDSLKEQIKQLEEDHKEELVTKVQELNAKYDLLSSEHEVEVLRLESTSTRKIEEWKSKAAFWQIEFIKLRTPTTKAAVVERKGVQTSNSSSPLNNAGNVSTGEELSAAKDHELGRGELAEDSQSNDLKISRTLPSAKSVVPRDHELELADAAERSQNSKDHELKRADVSESSQNSTLKLLRTMPTENSFVQRMLHTPLYKTDRDLNAGQGRYSKDKDLKLLRRMARGDSFIQGEHELKCALPVQMSTNNGVELISSALQSAASFIQRDDVFQLADALKVSISDDKKPLRTMPTASTTPVHRMHRHQLQKQNVNNVMALTTRDQSTKGERVIDLANPEEKEVIHKQSKRTKMVAEFPLIHPNPEAQGTVATRGKTSSRLSVPDCDQIKPSQQCLQTIVDKCKRKTKRVKFNEKQQSDVFSKALSDLFEMEELMDPYDDPYTFNE